MLGRTVLKVVLSEMETTLELGGGLICILGVAFNVGSGGGHILRLFS